MSRFFKYGLLGSIVMMLLFLSCQKDNPLPPAINYGYNYFPNTLKYYVIYNVDSMVRNTYRANPDTSYSYQIKEKIDSFYIDGSGRQTQKVVRYKRSDNTKPWVIEKVWSANRTTMNAQRDEDNITYVRLIFPVTLNATWNGNAYNTINNNDGSSYQYTSVDKPFSLNNANFDSTLIVIEDSTQNFVSHRFYMERYARNVGRIYRKYIDLECDSIYRPLGFYNLPVLDTLMQHLRTGSVVYVESYVSSGIDSL